jgi:hypothetical protein
MKNNLMLQYIRRSELLICAIFPNGRVPTSYEGTGIRLGLAHGRLAGTSVPHRMSENVARLFGGK